MADDENAPREKTGGGSRRAVACFMTYAEAERAVDQLADHDFPVGRVAIVARDLKLVEQVTGRRGYPEAALQGLISGAVVGFLIGWLFGIFNWFEPVTSAFWLALDGLWFGALLGALFGLLMQALSRGRRDFDSVAGLSADRYEVQVDDEVAAEAARLLLESLDRCPAASSTGDPVAPSARDTQRVRIRAER